MGPSSLLTRLGLGRVWELSTGAGVTVGVVDSGVDARHPKLAGAVGVGVEYSVVPDPRVFVAAPGGNVEDCANHGTAVASLIAGRRAGDGRFAGVAPDSVIVPIRIADDFTRAPDQLIAAAIMAAADAAKVINLSFAFPDDRPAIRDAITYARGKDVVIVAAGGNEGQQAPGKTWYPAAYDGVLAVAALDDKGLPLAESNSGPWIDVAAPGDNLLVAAQGGDGYLSVKGTSFASAVVSGVAALVKARFPSLRAEEVAARITGTAVPLTGGRDERVGAGMVDPFAALTSRLGVPAATAFEAGSIAVAPRPAAAPWLDPALATALAWAGGLTALAGVALLGGLSVRRARRRRWRAGGERFTPADNPRRSGGEPPGVELV
jgi:type VII secretion-associated serine protease mycosin